MICDDYAGVAGIYPGKTALIDISLSYYIEDTFYFELGNESIDIIEYDFGGFSYDGTEPEIVSHALELSKDVAAIKEGVDVVYDKDGIKMWSMGVCESYYGDYVVMILVKNDNEEHIAINPDDDTIKINGKEADADCYNSVAVAGKYSILTIEVSDDFIEENSIDKITEASVEIELLDEDYDTVDTTTLNVKIK